MMQVEGFVALARMIMNALLEQNVGLRFQKTKRAPRYINAMAVHRIKHAVEQTQLRRPPSAIKKMPRVIEM